MAGIGTMGMEAGKAINEWDGKKRLEKERKYEELL